MIHEDDIEIWKRHSTNGLREGPQITQMDADRYVSSDSAAGGIAAICAHLRDLRATVFEQMNRSG